MAPLRLSRFVDRVQGGDVDEATGVIFLSTDDEIDGIYGVEPATGNVVEIGRLAVTDWEAEGIDVTWIEQGPFTGLLHVMSVGGVQPGRFEHFADREG